MLSIACANGKSYKDVFDALGYEKYSDRVFDRLNRKIKSLGISTTHFVKNDVYRTIRGIKKTKGIYLIRNIINGKVYVGKSNNIHKRLLQHFGNPSDKLFYNDIRKYGINNFECMVLEECDDEQEQNKLEQKYIAKYNSSDENFGYNVAPGGKAMKISNEIVLSIIDDLKNSNMNSEVIGEKYNVSGRTIRSINSGQYQKLNGVSYPIREKLYTIQKKKKKFHKCPVCGRLTPNNTFCSPECSHISTRATDRPNRYDLKTMVRKMPFVKIAEKYNVCDNTIRKWCDEYGIPRKSHDIKSYSNEEWDKV